MKTHDKEVPKMGNELEILDGPVTDGQPVTGVCEGRIVAYWPSEEDERLGMRAVGSGGYIPAMITASWAGRGEQTSSVPCANINLIPDVSNIKTDLTVGRSSCRYSLKPARGCWTWIPKA